MLTTARGSSAGGCSQRPCLIRPEKWGDKQVTYSVLAPTKSTTPGHPNTDDCRRACVQNGRDESDNCLPAPVQFDRFVPQKHTAAAASSGVLAAANGKCRSYMHVRYVSCKECAGVDAGVEGRVCAQ
eukprot:scaffold322840_cov18-Tisochrysis_lutea.AAC.2